ncbi:hypothetical protein [Bergeyella sp. RCAD1439]|uniref:hypothetical protein n=1 Tax=Bergeyella anatis TaxID=3113737 RepID=UPI002E18238E|nr:hypothetical protein [Bergeyella sp. RCAD1439]
MKTLFLLTLAGLLPLLIACGRDEYNPNLTGIAPIAIDSVAIAQDTMEVFASQSLRTYSSYLNGCEGFYGYDYTLDGFTRYVKAYKFSTSANCGTPTERISQINFVPQETGTYTFLFSKGNDQWIEKKIVVK